MSKFEQWDEKSADWWRCLRLVVERMLEHGEPTKYGDYAVRAEDYELLQSVLITLTQDKKRG